MKTVLNVVGPFLVSATCGALVALVLILEHYSVEKIQRWSDSSTLPRIWTSRGMRLVIVVAAVIVCFYTGMIWIHIVFGLAVNITSNSWVKYVFLLLNFLFFFLPLVFLSKRIFRKST